MIHKRLVAPLIRARAIVACSSTSRVRSKAVATNTIAALAPDQQYRDYRIFASATSEREAIEICGGVPGSARACQDARQQLASPEHASLA
jgi:hypothetical protein